MSSGLTRFLELTFEHETGDDLVDHFHLDAEQEPDGAIKHVNDYGIETWRREGRPIGRGGFGTAWLEREAGGKTRVVKEVRKVIPSVKTRYWVRELSSMALLSKDKIHFPEFYGWFQDESYVYIAMEHFALGDLQNCVHNRLPQDQASCVIFQICTALEVMHRRRITHRDLKPANVLVRHPAPTWQVVVSDFGVSKRVRGVTTVLHTSFEGDFMAPEVLGFVDDGTSGEYTDAVDLWSLGCLAYWLLKTTMPVPRHKMMAHCSRSWSDAANAIVTTDIDDVGKDFILCLLKPEPKQRLTATQALVHDWLKQTRMSPAASKQVSPELEHAPQPSAQKSGAKQQQGQQELYNQVFGRAFESVTGQLGQTARPKSREDEPAITQIISRKRPPSLRSAKRDNSLLNKRSASDDDRSFDNPQPSHEKTSKISVAGDVRGLRAQDPTARQSLAGSVRRDAESGISAEQATQLHKGIWASPDLAQDYRDLIAEEDQQMAKLNELLPDRTAPGKDGPESSSRHAPQLWRERHMHYGDLQHSGRSPEQVRIATPIDAPSEPQEYRGGGPTLPYREPANNYSTKKTDATAGQRPDGFPKFTITKTDNTVAKTLQPSDSNGSSLEYDADSRISRPTSVHEKLSAASATSSSKAGSNKLPSDVSYSLTPTPDPYRWRLSDADLPGVNHVSTRKDAHDANGSSLISNTGLVHRAKATSSLGFPEDYTEMDLPLTDPGAGTLAYTLGPVFKVGWVKCKDDNLWSSWSRRRMVLRSSSLDFYKSLGPTERHPKAVLSIALHDISKISRLYHKIDCALLIVWRPYGARKVKQITCQTSSVVELQEWMDAIDDRRSPYGWGTVKRNRSNDAIYNFE